MKRKITITLQYDLAIGKVNLKAIVLNWNGLQDTLDCLESALNLDELVKSRKVPFFVIPAKAGIQSIQLLTRALDSGFHRSDDFLRVHQILITPILR